MTYDAHDVDDAAKLGLVQLDEVHQQEMIKICVAIIGDRQCIRSGRIPNGL